METENDYIDSRISQETLDEVLSAFSNNSKLEDLDSDNSLAKIGKECGVLFDAGIKLLCSFNNPIINNLMIDVWDIFRYKHVVLAIGPTVPSLSFCIVQSKNGVLRSMAFAPYFWPSMIDEDPVMELAAIISIGSQIVDFYNNKILSLEESKISKERALSYEAEFFKVAIGAGHKLNGYQMSTLQKYPNGFDIQFNYPRRKVISNSDSD